jgi:hypothetical protein
MQKRTTYTAIDVEYRELKARGWRYLRKGMFFLMVCLLIAEIFEAMDWPFTNVIVQSATIAGWVALWKPMEILLYDVPELRERRKK